MDIWVVISRWEFESDATTHLTAGGALLQAIGDVLDFLNIASDADYLACLENNYGDLERSELGVWVPEELKNSTVEELWLIYGYWTEFTWESKADWEIIRTTVRP
jgi:hypothetical protein